MTIIFAKTQTQASIYQLGSNFVKQLFRIQIQKGGKVLLWNQVKSRMEACYSELILSVASSRHTSKDSTEKKIITDFYCRGDLILLVP